MHTQLSITPENTQSNHLSQYRRHRQFNTGPVALTKMQSSHMCQIPITLWKMQLMNESTDAIHSNPKQYYSAIYLRILIS